MMNKQRQVLCQINPLTGERSGQVDITDIGDVPRLYERARAAFMSWGKTSVRERIRLLQNLRFLIIDYLDEIVRVIEESTGKPGVEILTSDVLSTIDMIHYIEKHADRILSRKKVSTPLLLFDKRSYVEYKPKGVVLVISPWNFPFQLAMEPVLSALVAGNTVIIKPSEVTPLVGKMIEELFERAEFPKDVVQVAHGDGELGAALVQGLPDHIFFTGSVCAGKEVQENAAKNLIPTTLELGGKDPMIVFADAPFERAVHGALWGGLTNSGQVCMSVERLYVETSIYDEFVNSLVGEVERLRSGTGQGDDLGAMTWIGQIEVIKEHVEDALSKGAKLLTGKKPDAWNTEQGLLIEPMVLVDVTQDMRVMREETFGPIIPIVPFDSEEEVVRLANDTVYGLSASVWTSDLNRGKRIARELTAGNVVINDVIVSIANHHLPFGGVKHSGLGRYHGKVGLRTFCHETSVMVDSGRRQKEVNWFPYAEKYQPFSTLIKSYYGKRLGLSGLVKAYIRLLKGS